MPDDFNAFLATTIDKYVEIVSNSFQTRMKGWDLDIFEKETNEVIGGLLARQSSFAMTIASSPLIWNAHVLPILLRCMADLYITFCWIAKDVRNRSRLYVEYGLGQEKLAIEKYRETLSQELNPDPDAVKFIEWREAQLDCERSRFLLPVNLGSWNEMSVRDMAIDVKEKAFYDLVFTQFSSSVHSTWQHIWQANLMPCTNPLHMGHRVPCIPTMPLDINLFMNSAKYLCKTFHRFDTALLHRDLSAYACYDFLCGRFSGYAPKASRRGKPKKSCKRSAPKTHSQKEGAARRNRGH